MDNFLYLYDTLTNKKKQLPNSDISIYLCGPTVYDDVHLGNLRPIIIFDFLIRYLKHKKIPFKYIQNITDIDDKIIAKSHSLFIPEEDVANFFKQNFFDVLKKTNVIFPETFLCVTDNIEEIISVIKELIEKKHAYIKNGSVYFDISKIACYLELSKQKPEFLLNEGEEDQNFVIWKNTSFGKQWNSPWGFGRPGWHIECFALIKKIFNGRITIHGGGMDLKFPHHENENAICHSFFDCSLSEIWTHIGHLQINQQKISKSSNKRFLAKDIVKKYSHNLIRYVFLLCHYSKPFDISEEKLTIFNNEWKTFETCINHVKSMLFLENIKYRKKETNISNDLLKHIENDLNMPNVLPLLNQKKLNILQKIKKKEFNNLLIDLHDLVSHLEFLGFFIKRIHTKEMKEKLTKWKDALDQKNYQEADNLRNELEKKGLLY